MKCSFCDTRKKCINDLSVEGYSLCLSLKMLKLSNSLFCPYNPLPIFFSLFFEIHGKSYLWHFYKKSILLFLSFMRYKSIKTIPMQSLWKFERDLIFRKISKVKYLKKIASKKGIVTLYQYHLLICSSTHALSKYYSYFKS